MKNQVKKKVECFLIRLSILPFIAVFGIYSICAGAYWVLTGKGLESKLIDDWTQKIWEAEE